MLLPDVIEHLPALIVSRTQQELDLIQIAERRLRIEIEFPERLDLVAEELGPNRRSRLPRIDIENSTADRELPARCHLCDALVTGFA